MILLAPILKAFLLHDWIKKGRSFGVGRIR